MVGALMVPTFIIATATILPTQPSKTQMPLQVQETTHAKATYKSKPTKHDTEPTKESPENTTKVKDAKPTKSDETTDEIAPTQTTEEAAIEETSPQETTIVDFGWPRVAYFDYHAHDDGSVVEWAPGWFNAHSTSSWGQLMLALEVGDEVMVNGETATVTNLVAVSELMPYEDIREQIAGWDTICFQTCIEGTGQHLMVIAQPHTPHVYGHNEPETYETEYMVEDEPYQEGASVSGVIGAE